MKTTVSLVLRDIELERLDFLINDFQSTSPEGLNWRRSDVIRYAINNLYALRKESADTKMS